LTVYAGEYTEYEKTASYEDHELEQRLDEDFASVSIYIWVLFKVAVDKRLKLVMV
jgi:hypothetical protein